MRRILAWILSLLLGVVVIALSADKQETPRVPLVGDHPSDPGVAKVFDDIRAQNQEILNTYRIQANAPALFLASHNYALKLRYSAKVSRQYRELLILRVTQVANGHYEYVHHIPLALSCGVSQAQIDALPHWHKSSAFNPKERAVLAFSDGMAEGSGPDDATFHTLSSFFSPQEIVELAMTDGFYLSSSRISTALRTPLELDRGAGSIPHGC